MTKRVGNIYQKIYDIETINYADNKARLHKRHRWGIIKHDKNRNKENLELSNIIKEHKYHTSEYTTFKIYEPKERIIYRLPYYPDRIAQHAIMAILVPI